MSPLRGTPAPHFTQSPDIRDLSSRARTLIVFARFGVVARRTLGTRSPSGLVPLARRLGGLRDVPVRVSVLCCVAMTVGLRRRGRVASCCKLDRMVCKPRAGADSVSIGFALSHELMYATR